jgi:hypothetical protein
MESAGITWFSGINWGSHGESTESYELGIYKIISEEDRF